MLVLILVVGGGIVVRLVRDSSTPLSAPEVVSASPASGALNVDWSAPISIVYTHPLALYSQLPQLSPSVTGSWTWRGTSTVTFRPDRFYLPGVTYTLNIPEGRRGGTHHASRAGAETVVRFQVATPSVTRLEQLLAELGYLPLSFSSGDRTPAQTLAANPTNVSAIALSTQAGSFSWRFVHNPESLVALFEPGYWSVLDQAAVMSFEAAQGLPVDGVPGPAVWSALLRAVARRETDPLPYDYVIASEKLPERVQVWSNGEVVFTSLANTGVNGAATPLGTWPVRQRFVSETMRGVDPDGYHYVDKGVHDIAYFYGSDAVHGFVRASYGWPQSNGCVELPLRAAKIVFGLDPLGTLVTVTSGPLPTLANNFV